MSIVYMDDTDLYAIGDAIREVNGTDTTYQTGEMADAIRELDTVVVSASRVDSGVEFIDHDGTVLYSYSWDEIAELTELPECPDWIAGKAYGMNIPMTFQEWNWTLSELQSHTQSHVTVGAIYCPTDGLTHFIMRICPEDNVKIGLIPTVSGGAVIDWGDGETTTTSGTSQAWYSHDYSNDAEMYIDVTLEVTSGKVELEGSGLNWSSTASYGLFHQSTYVPDHNASYFDSGTVGNMHKRTQCRAMYLGSGVYSIGERAMQGCFTVREITMPPDFTSISESAFENTAIWTVILPRGVTTLNQYVYNDCYSLTTISFPAAFTTIKAYAFQACYALTGIDLPDSTVSVLDYAFYGCDSIARLTGLYTTASTTSAVLYCSRLINVTARYIGGSISFTNSTLLTVDSLNSIIAALADYSNSSSTYTLTIGSTNLAKLTDDEIAVGTDKGWTIS